MTIRGWGRLWVVATILMILIAAALAWRAPDLYSLTEKWSGKDSSGRVTAETSFVSTSNDWPDNYDYRRSSCVPFTIRRGFEKHRSLVDEIFGNAPAGQDEILMVARCTSWKRLGIYVAVALGIAVGILLFGLSMVWVRRGFRES